MLSRVADSLYWRSYWGRIIRGPAWGTFLSAAHVEQIGGLDSVRSSSARIEQLASGGAFVQLTDVGDPILDGSSRPELAVLESTLHLVREHK